MKPRAKRNKTYDCMIKYHHNVVPDDYMYTTIMYIRVLQMPWIRSSVHLIPHFLFARLKLFEQLIRLDNKQASLQKHKHIY